MGCHWSTISSHGWIWRVYGNRLAHLRCHYWKTHKKRKSRVCGTSAAMWKVAVLLVTSCLLLIVCFILAHSKKKQHTILAATKKHEQWSWMMHSHRSLFEFRMLSTGKLAQSYCWTLQGSRQIVNSFSSHHTTRLIFKAPHKWNCTICNLQNEASLKSYSPKPFNATKHSSLSGNPLSGKLLGN